MRSAVIVKGRENTKLLKSPFFPDRNGKIIIVQGSQN